jgi:hypothetical protein
MKGLVKNDIYGNKQVFLLNPFVDKIFMQLLDDEKIIKYPVYMTQAFPTSSFCIQGLIQQSYLYFCFVLLTMNATITSTHNMKFDCE